MFALQSGQIVSDETISDLVTELSQIGEGSCRMVFDLGDVVLKVNRGHRSTLHGSCETEAMHWEHFAGTEHEDLFAPVLASGDGWLVMAKADSISTADEDDYDAVKSAANRLGITDLFHANIGIFAGQCKVIDYATGHLGYGYASDYDYSGSPQCECMEHDCRACYPDGCECCCSLHNWDGCEEWSGCNREECDDCYASARHHWQDTFGFVRGVIVTAGPDGVGKVQTWRYHHACEDHVPASVRPLVRVEIPRQGRFVPLNGGSFTGSVLVLDAVTQCHALLNSLEAI